MTGRHADRSRPPKARRLLARRQRSCGQWRPFYLPLQCWMEILKAIILLGGIPYLGPTSVFIEKNILFQGRFIAVWSAIRGQRRLAMKTLFQFAAAAAVQRLGAAILFSAALTASVAGAHAEPLVTAEWLN